MGSSVHNSLNVPYLNGCLLVSAGFAFAVGSWLVFPALLALTLGTGLYSGEIRPARPAR